MSVFSNFIKILTRNPNRNVRPKRSFTLSVRRQQLEEQRKEPLVMEKCLIVSKVTRYEYERHSHENLSEDQLEKVLRRRGSDYDHMIQSHKTQKQFEAKVSQCLENMGIEVKMASRLTYDENLIKWCDVILPCGGDGTFLLAASRVRNALKPVIGFNSAPHKSVGRLCLPTWCSYDIHGALAALKEGRFRWMRRTRIRTTVNCQKNVQASLVPVDLHTLQYSRYPSPTPEAEHPTRCSSSPPNNPCDDGEVELSTCVLPFLALNEVFLGESVTSRVSILQLRIDNSSWTHTKSSGLCVTTGTGSTSWHFSINCLRTHSVLELMKILSQQFGIRMDTSLEKAREVTEEYNQKLMFAPDAKKLAYSVRELITFEDWPTPRGLRMRNFANSVSVKSHCIDAGLVIDGSVFYPFNDGTCATLEIYPEDSLMTVHMDEQDQQCRETK